MDLPEICTSAQHAKFFGESRNEAGVFHDSIPVPLCGELPKEHAKKLIHGAFTPAERYLGPSDVCVVQDVNPTWLVEKFKGKLVVFLGDSHARNLFTAFVGEVRNQKIIAERHPDPYTKEFLAPYQLYEIYHDEDYLIDAANAHALTYETARGNCLAKSCVAVLYLWAGFYKEYEKLLSPENGLLSKLVPDVIVTDWITPTYREDTQDTFALLALSWRALFATRRTDAPPLKFISSPFPLMGGHHTIANVSTWLELANTQSFFKEHHVDAFLVDQTQLIAAHDRSGLHLEQLRATAHGVCGLYDVFSLDPAKVIQPAIKISAYGRTCVAPIERAVIQVAMTFASLGHV